jgi:putative endonuclease
VSALKGQGLKDFEDMLDAITCAYTIYFCQKNEARFYKVDDEDIFVTPISPWKVYMLRCVDKTLYTGVTTDLKRRINEHNTSTIGAKYTRNRRPVELVYFENCDDKVDAMKREYAIKQLSRKDKLKLVDV